MKLSKEFIAMFREEARRARWEINSWNGKSIDDLVIDYLERKELKPEDFTGAVVMTLDEAKDLLSWLRNSQWKHKYQCNFEFAEDWRKDMFDCLNERIEKAEGMQ